MIDGNVDALTRSLIGISGSDLDGRSGIRRLLADLMKGTNACFIRACENNSPPVDKIDVVTADIADCVDDLLCKLFVNHSGILPFVKSH